MTFRPLLARAARLLGRSRGPGYIDHFDHNRVAGWAFNPADPSSPALLSVHIDGQPAMNIVADLPREDVQAAGLGPLRSGFEASLPRRLRDGKAHRVEIRLGLDGPVLKGGARTVEAAPDGARSEAEAEAGTEAPKAAAIEAEGVAFFDRRRGAISGWAIGCGAVHVSLDGGPGRRVVLDREVPGFGSGMRPGFVVPVPPELMDGAWHEAEIRVAPDGARLDGTPLRFRATPDLPLVEIVAQSGPLLTLGLRHPDGRPARHAVEILGDGTPLDAMAGERPGEWRLALPDGLRHLVIRERPEPAEAVETGAAETGADAVAEPAAPQAPAVLARFVLRGGMLADMPLGDLPEEALGAARLIEARAAFDAFCSAPDDRFDPLWYRWSVPGARALETAEEALAHYRDTGAEAGASPGPSFDEAAARRLHPELADLVAAGDLPCAFALELALGRGALGTLAHLPPVLAHALARGAEPPLPAALGPRPETAPPPAPVVAHLPPPSQAQEASQGIYAAWLARLDIPATTRAELAADEQAQRQEIAATALARAPLVSIIMPTWNRAFTIGEAIQSVLEQSYGNWELIVSDDASEDRTAEVVRNFDDPRIRYMKFLKSNGAGARNKGLRFARGEYIAYLDSDNIWHPLFLDMMLRRLLDRPGNAIAYSAYLDTEIEGAKVRLHTVSRPNFRPIRLASKNFMDLNTIVHHRRVHDWLGGFDNSLPRLQDWDLALRYTGIFRPVFVNRVGVFYRRNLAWGQVTHLHMGSGAQNTVNEKTRRRQEEGHERLSIAWPARGRVTVLCGGPPGHGAPVQAAASAAGLAALAAEVADVDLVELGAPDPHASDDARITSHAVPQALQADPLRLGHALGPLLRDRPVLSVGLRGGYLRALAGGATTRVYRLRGTGEGCALIGLDLPEARFDLGALPLALPEGTHAPAGMTVLVLPPHPAGEALLAQLAAEARRRGLGLILPPEGGQGWTRIGPSGTETLAIPSGTHFPAELGQVAITAVLMPVSELDPFGLSLLNALQGRGVPAAVFNDAGRARASGLARQWIEAKAAYELQVKDPKWIFDKIRKLLEDAGSMARLQERSLAVHRIALPPDLARERLAHALYRLMHDAPRREVIDVRG